MKKERRIGGKHLEEWNKWWRPLDGGLRVRHRALRHDAGLFRTTLDGEEVFLGRATQAGKGGIPARLAQLYRGDRKAHPLSAAAKIHAVRDEVEIEVLVVGTNWRSVEVGRWAKGPKGPKPDTILKLADALGCSPRDFDPDYADSKAGVVVSGRVSAASHNAYAAMKFVYKVTPTQILELAPILLSIVAARALEIPAEDAAFVDAHESEAAKRGIRLERFGNCDEVEGLDLDLQAVRNRNCFGLEPDYDSTAFSRNIFYEAIRRMVADTGNQVDVGMWNWGWPGDAPGANGFNPHVEFLDLIADGDHEIIRRLVRGEVRLSSSLDKAEIAKQRNLGPLAELVRKDLADQAAAHRLVLEHSRLASQARLDQWRQAYAYEHPDLAQEYDALVAAHCKPVGWYPDTWDAERRERDFATPFNETRFIDDALLPKNANNKSPGGLRILSIHPVTRRMKELEKHRLGEGIFWEVTES